MSTSEKNIEKDFRMTATENVYGSMDILRLRERMCIDHFELIEHGLNTNRTELNCLNSFYGSLGFWQEWSITGVDGFKTI